MINKENNIFDTLSDEAIKPYKKVKTMINKIYGTVEKKVNIDELKTEFRKSYKTYARELEKKGYKDESTYMMVVCGKYILLTDEPEILLANKQFFKDLFDRIDELICIKTNNPEIYEEEFHKFRRFYINQADYFTTELYTPQKPLDDKQPIKFYLQ